LGFELRFMGDIAFDRDIIDDLARGVAHG
jgi:hypothetical protein